MILSARKFFMVLLLIGGSGMLASSAFMTSLPPWNPSCPIDYIPVCGQFSCTATPGTACDPLPPRTFNNACLAKQGGASSILEGACEKNPNNTGAVICPIPSVPAPPEGCRYISDSYNTTDIPGCKIPNYTLSCENTQICTREYSPVCAQPPMPSCGGGMACIQAFPPLKTYGNKCEANKAKASIRYDGACKEDRPEEPVCPAVMKPVCGVKKTTVQCIKAPCDPTVVKKTFNNSCHAINEGFTEYTSGACKTEEVCTNEYAPVCGQFSCTATPGTACLPPPSRTFNNACLAKQGGASSTLEGACEKNPNNTGAVICPVESIPVPPNGCSYTIDSYNTTDIPGCKMPKYTLSCENTQICTKEYAPVCAQPPMPPCPEGMACIQAFPPLKTYGNKCEANKAKASIRYDGACKVDKPEEPVYCPTVMKPVCGVKKTTVQCIKAPCDPIVVKKSFNNSCLAENEGFKEYTSGACSSDPIVQVSKVVNPYASTLPSYTKKTLNKWINTNVKSKSSKLSQEKYIAHITSVTSKLEDLLKKTSNQKNINTIKYLIFELDAIQSSLRGDD